MTIKEKLFCHYYCILQNHKEAAIKSGIDPIYADVDGISLLKKSDVKNYINSILSEKKNINLSQKSIIGLERLAFGSVNDSIKLLFYENLDQIKDLPNLDLFNISEIKKIKGGGFEIKFFDRIKALEKISDIAQSISDSNDSLNLFNAIESSANAISKNIISINNSQKVTDYD